jgi:hypothetical protein
MCNFADVRRFALTYLPLLAGLLLLLSGCGPREIPDRKMESIIHDIFMANAYYAQFGSHIRTDSVDFYAPIFKKHGYDIADFRHTLDRWALQKSSRLTDLIADATADIQRENQYYEFRELQQRRTDTLIRARYLDTLLFRPDSIQVRRVKDRDSLILRLPAPTGTYRLSYTYRLAPADRNDYLSMRYKVRDSLKAVVETASRTLIRDSRKKNYIDLSFSAPAGSDSLELILADYPEKPKEMMLVADSILITYNAPIEELRERFLREMIRLELGISTPYESNYPPKDSGALCVVSPLRPDTAARAEF